jgi:hypothetical protein
MAPWMRLMVSWEGPFVIMDTAMHVAKFAASDQIAP